MIEFEKYLLDKGYKPYHYNFNNKKWEYGWKGLSSLDNIDNLFLPENIEPSQENYLTYGFVIGVGQTPPMIEYPYLDNIRRLITEMSNDELFNELNKNRINE